MDVVISKHEDISFVVHLHQSSGVTRYIVNSGEAPCSQQK